MRWLVAILVVVALAFGVRAAPPEGADSRLSDWYSSLRTPSGVSCCSIADCRPHTYRTAGDHYQIDHDGQWLDVPNEKVLQRYDNPTGRAVACVLGGQVLCFVKAAES